MKPSPETENDKEEELTPKPVSGIAAAVAKLKDSSVSALNRRGTLPQPMFWAHFNAEVKEIKRKKAEARLFSSLFDPIE